MGRSLERTFSIPSQLAHLKLERPLVTPVVEGLWKTPPPQALSSQVGHWRDLDQLRGREQAPTVAPTATWGSLHLPRSPRKRHLQKKRLSSSWAC